MTRTSLSFPAIHIGVGGLSAKWWDEINESVEWQDGIFFSLCAAYALVSCIALMQLIRIELRVPEYGWTTQKFFHLMNFIVNGVRALVFGFHKNVFLLHPKALIWVTLDLPGLLFFSTFTLLVLFSTSGNMYRILIKIHTLRARSLPTDKLRIFYVSTNSLIYFIQVASVTAICFTCFLIRCYVIILSAFDSDTSLDLLDHPILNLIYYTLVEILPSVLVLFILRKLPPKRISAQYHPIR